MDVIPGTDPAIGELIQAAANALRYAGSDSLAAVVTAVSSAAGDAGLVVVPAALPPVDDAGPVVLLDPEQVDPSRLIAIATASGSALLFLQTRTVDTADMTASLQGLDINSENTRALSAVIKQVSKIDGWTSSLDVAFAHQGTLVVWASIASWSEDLYGLLDAFEDVLDSPGSHSLTEQHRRAELDDAEVAALVRQVASVATFRRARASEREAALRAIPEIAALGRDGAARWQVGTILRPCGKPANSSRPRSTPQSNSLLRAATSWPRLSPPIHSSR